MRRFDHCLEWRDEIFKLLKSYEPKLPKSCAEKKDSVLTFHYKMVEETYYPVIEELLLEIKCAVKDSQLNVINGTKITEIMHKEQHKGTVMAELRRDSFILCAGDDLTDEDMFKDTADSEISIVVGKKKNSNAKYYCEDVEAFLKFLEYVNDNL